MSGNLLQTHFPMIRTREEVLSIVNGNPDFSLLFHDWSMDQQQEFIDFCTGERGVKILYDSFFKEIFNPEYAPERLEQLLSLIMGQSVRILHVLPNDSTRIADESSLLITDIVVELADHSIANIEIRKVGYMFPGQRCACYSADMLLRQYKRLRSKYHQNFNYKNIKTVYTIIFFERSTKEFHAYPEDYLHYFSQTSNTGLELDLLQKYYFLPLDIFRKIIQNKGIRTELDAWLTFLSVDEPEMIAALIHKFPQFKAMYGDIYELCTNMERVMHMFSKELRELDKNTVQYMIDEMQDEIDEKKLQLEENERILEVQKEQLREQNDQLREQDVRLKEQISQLKAQDDQLKAQDDQLKAQDTQLKAQNDQIKAQDDQLKAQDTQLKAQDDQIKAQDDQIKAQLRVQKLYSLLAEAGLTEDLTRAVTDKAYCEELIMKYSL